MNTTADIPAPPVPDIPAPPTPPVPSVPEAAANPVLQFEDYVRQHPGTALLVAAGLGLAAVLVTRVLTPAPPRNRAVQLLEDIQHRLAGLAEDGAQALSKGVDGLGNLHLDHKVDRLSRRLKGLFQ